MPMNQSDGSAETWPKISFTWRVSVAVARLLGFMTTSTFVPDDGTAIAPAAAETATAARRAVMSSTEILTGPPAPGLRRGPDAAAAERRRACRPRAGAAAVR